MRMGQRYILVQLIILFITTPAHALHSPGGTDLVEINHHQAAATAALIMGDHTLLEPSNYAVSGHVYMSGWDTDAIYGAWGLSVQARPWERWGLGLSYGSTDAQLRTQSLLLNAQFSALPEPDSWLQFQAAIGHQFLDSSESGNVLIHEFDYATTIPSENPEILMDDMNWTHAYLSVQAQTLLWRFRPQTSLGYIFSYYSWSGHEAGTYGGLGGQLGPALSDSGTTGTVTWSLGLGLDLGPVRPFVGMKIFSDGGLFLARMTIVF
jgi:hypothetical protein